MTDLKDDPGQIYKNAYRQIWADCDRGDIEIIPQHGITFCIKKRNDDEDRIGSIYMFISIHQPLIDENISSRIQTTSPRSMESAENSRKF